MLRSLSVVPTRSDPSDHLASSWQLVGGHLHPSSLSAHRWLGRDYLAPSLRLQGYWRAPHVAAPPFLPLSGRWALECSIRLADAAATATVGGMSLAGIAALLSPALE